MKNLFISVFILGTAFLNGTTYGQNFHVVDTLPEGAYGYSAWGDYNNDGLKDLVYLSQTLPNASCKIYSFNGTSFVELPQQFPLLYNPGACWADLNNDGFDDLVVNGMDSTFISKTFIYQSLGNGTFNSIPNNITGLSACSVDIDDYNNDGFRDIAVTGYDNFSNEMAYIYKNAGGFTFTDIQASLIGVHFGEVKWGDYNNDGLKDLLINGVCSAGFRARLYENLGNDNFQLTNIYMKGSGGTADWADFDNDGWQDILITGYDSTFVNSFTDLHHNNHNGTFTTLTSALPDFGEPSAVTIADFNNDNNLDVCFMGGSSQFFSSYSALSYGAGNNTFSSQGFITAAIVNTMTAAADYDNDGDQDVMVGNYILRNDGLTSVATNNSVISNEFYPQPAQNKVRLTKGIAAIRLAIYDLEGRKLKEVNLAYKENAEIDVVDLKEGIYLAQFTLKSGNHETSKLIIAR